VNDFYKNIFSQVDDVIEKTKVKQEVEWKLDPEILALLQASSQQNNFTQKQEANDWKFVIEDDIITGVKNVVTGVEKSLKLPVIIAPKILLYDAYEQL